MNTKQQKRLDKKIEALDEQIDLLKDYFCDDPISTFMYTHTKTKTLNNQIEELKESNQKTKHTLKPCSVN